MISLLAKNKPSATNVLAMKKPKPNKKKPQTQKPKNQKQKEKKSNNNKKPTQT